MGERDRTPAGMSLLTTGAWVENMLFMDDEPTLETVRLRSWQRREGWGLIASPSGGQAPNGRRSADDGCAFKSVCIRALELARCGKSNN